MEPEHIVSCYREFAPSEALKDHVRAFFSFTPPSDRAAVRRPMTSEVIFRAGHSFCSPMFADGHASIVFDLAISKVSDLETFNGNPTETDINPGNLIYRMLAVKSRASV